MLKLFKEMRDELRQASGLRKDLATLRAELWQVINTQNKLKQTLGRIENRQLRAANDLRLEANEFQAFSQWGEDGLIQHLVRHIPVANKTFVEFGVQNYVESNTRFLLLNDNWTGLVLDSSPDNINFIRQDGISWQHNLTAVQAFVTRDNIDALLSTHAMTGEIGLLSIDIDGNDYWVWEAITVVRPTLVIVEYNSRFGPDRAVTIPYDEHFDRSKAHHSNTYYGASLNALCLLGKRKGYDFVGSNRAGNNAFFVRSSLRPAAVRAMSAEQGYVQSQFREARDENGNLAYLNLEQEQAILATLPLVDVE